MRRSFRVMTVCTLAVLLSFPPAMACPPVCCSPCRVVCAPPPICCPTPVPSCNPVYHGDAIYGAPVESHSYEVEGEVHSDLMIPGSVVAPTLEDAPDGSPSDMPEASKPPVPEATPDAEEPGEDAKPPETPAEQPEPEKDDSEALDDLFSNSSAEPSSDPQPVVDAASDLNDAVETEAAEPSSLEDLFDGGDEAAPEDLPEAKEVPEADDLFGDPSDSSTQNQGDPDSPQAAATQIGAAVKSADVVVMVDGGLSSTKLRTWVDDTGNYSCQARLQEVLNGRVRLVKSNGRTTTVPMHRLSVADQGFVSQQAMASNSLLASRTAQF